MSGSTMSDDVPVDITDDGSPDALVRAFEAERPRLLRVAYATTGSWAEAEDCVQDAWLRLRRSDTATIRDLPAWLTTTVARLALDVLRAARTRREQYVGTWLPEPLVGPAEPVSLGPDPVDPADRVTLDDEVSMALMVVLETLSPAQRAAFVLHDVFGVPFDEVAAVVGRTPAAVRQLASRARHDVEAARPRRRPSAQEQRALLDAFSAACTVGDLDALVALLAPDAVLRSDGGGHVPTVRDVQVGADLVARILLGFMRKAPRWVTLATVNGTPGAVMEDSHGVLTVVALTTDADGGPARITAVDLVRNPEKLTHVRA